MRKPKLKEIKIKSPLWHYEMPEGIVTIYSRDSKNEIPRAQALWLLEHAKQQLLNG